MSQIKALRQYACQQRWDVVAEFVEEGVSGRTDDRPQFQAMFRRELGIDVRSMTEPSRTGLIPGS